MLLDTSGLLCIHDQTEAFHGLARSFYQSAKSRLTHSYVLAEFVTLANSRGSPRTEAGPVTARFEGAAQLHVGETVSIAADLSSLHLFHAADGTAL